MPMPQPPLTRSFHYRVVLMLPAKYDSNIVSLHQDAA